MISSEQCVGWILRFIMRMDQKSYISNTSQTWIVAMENDANTAVSTKSYWPSIPSWPGANHPITILSNWVAWESFARWNSLLLSADGKSKTHRLLTRDFHGFHGNNYIWPSSKHALLIEKRNTRPSFCPPNNVEIALPTKSWTPTLARRDGRSSNKKIPLFTRVLYFSTIKIYCSSSLSGSNLHHNFRLTIRPLERSRVLAAFLAGPWSPPQAKITSLYPEFHHSSQELVFSPPPIWKLGDINSLHNRFNKTQCRQCRPLASSHVSYSHVFVQSGDLYNIEWRRAPHA